MVIAGNLQGVKFGVTTNSGTGVVTGAMMTITPDVAINLLQRMSLTYGALVENSMGLVSYGSIGTNRKVKFAQLTSATKHMIRPRGDQGCIWEPVGSIAMRTNEFSIYPVKYQGQICADTFWGTCLEKLMGVGNDIEDLLGSPETRKIVLELIASIYESLGDSIWNLAWFAEHPAIALANTNNSYNVDAEEWKNFKLQQQDVGFGGWMTLVEGLKAGGLPHYNIQIKKADLGAEQSYVGNVGRDGGLFTRLVKGSHKNMKLLNSRTIQGGVTGAQLGRQAILVTRAIFEAYERELALDFPSIPATYYYHLTQKFINEQGLDGMLNSAAPARGVTMWKGHLVKMMESWDHFYDICGLDAHIAMMAAPGVFGLATDVPALAQYSGLGMIVESKKGAPDLGKIYLHTNLEMGTGIVNDELITYASLILPRVAI